MNEIKSAYFTKEEQREAFWGRVFDEIVTGFSILAGAMIVVLGVLLVAKNLM